MYVIVKKMQRQCKGCVVVGWNIKHYHPLWVTCDTSWEQYVKCVAVLHATLLWHKTQGFFLVACYNEDLFWTEPFKDILLMRFLKVNDDLKKSVRSSTLTII